MFGRPTDDAHIVTESQVAEVLRKQYRHGKAKDVGHALALLDRAGLAAQGAGTSREACAIATRGPPEPPIEQMTLDL